ncbi:DUF2971 domain-containing protein [Propionispira raffinosivorans]|uniref:DUF2971 domain-containing protein n=1 Tax=Propionispira raffinosivorans TaxID=86959 RepID=UPI0003691714|nr:DUF2971 domain-containing protein [Propionispira raffinosivorans]
MENDVFLYKYISFSRFVELIELHRLYLTKITLWEDPYEGFPVKKNFNEGIPTWVVEKMNKKLIEAGKNSVLQHTYAQSWTDTREESDAMWRIYSQDKLGVRITVKLAQILQQITEAVTKINSTIKVNHYKVKYHQGYNVDNCRTPDKMGIIMTDKAICELKRPAFEHEAEYRISCSLKLADTMRKNNSSMMSEIELADIFEKIQTPPVIHYDVPIDSICEVILDPRAPESHKKTFLEYCKNRGFDQHNVLFQKSNLYTLL